MRHWHRPQIYRISVDGMWCNDRTGAWVPGFSVNWEEDHCSCQRLRTSKEVWALIDSLPEGLHVDVSHEFWVNGVIAVNAYRGVSGHTAPFVLVDVYKYGQSVTARIKAKRHRKRR